MKFPSKKQLFLIFCSILIVFCFWFCFSYFSFLKQPLVPIGQQPVTFIFNQGFSVKGLAHKLQKLQVLKKPSFFVVLTKFASVGQTLKAGEYRIDPGDTPYKLVEKIINGEVVHHVFTIIEGWNFHQALMALINNPDIEHTLQNLNEDEIMRAIGHEGERAEGRFAPDTYFFSGPVKDVYLLGNAYKLMQKRLQEAWLKRDSNVPYHCPYEALIVASMIEKETAANAEKAKIAGVILRRLQKNMPLQIDATVIYGLGSEYNGKLKPAGMRTDSSYNTYKHKGLPSSPISMPSKNSIDAALHPMIGTELYYVAKGDGTHVFSNTLDGQKQAIKKYSRRNHSK